MARRANLSEVEEDADRRGETEASTRRSRSHVHVASLSPSPAASFSSDKENRQAQAEGSRKGKGKGKGRTIPSPRLASPATGEDDAPRSNKRRKLSEREAPNATQTAYRNHLAEIGDSRYYDPDQSMGERRALRKDFRDLSKELTGTLRSWLRYESRIELTLGSRLPR